MVYLHIATVGYENGLSFIYFEHIESDEQMFHELFNDNMQSWQRVVAYHSTLLIMFAQTLKRIKGHNITGKEVSVCKETIIPKAVDTEFSKYC